MSGDLEETLGELGPEYAVVVDRLKGAFALELRDGALRSRAVRFSFRRILGWGTGTLAAALLLAFTLGVLLRPSAPDRDSSASASGIAVYTLAYASDARAIGDIVATQKPDGSWVNDFVTRQNAAALRGETAVAARVAYKKAVRYLKSRGLRPLSGLELKSRGDAAARGLDRI